MRKLPNGPNVVVAQRDEASAYGRIRFLGSVTLRLVAMHLGLVPDPS
jgi:hypothetical protein